MKDYRILRIWPVYIGSILVSILSLLAPFLEGKMIDSLVYNTNTAMFQKYLVILIGIIVFQFLTNYIVDRYKSLEKEKLVLSTMKATLEKLFKKDTSAILEFSPSYLHSRILEDIAQIWTFFFETCSALITNTITLLFVLVMVYQTSLLIFWILLIFPPIYLFIYKVFYPKLSHVEREISESSNHVYASRETLFHRYLEIKARNVLANETKRMKIKEKTLLDSIFESFTINYTIYGLKLSVNSLLKIAVFMIMGAMIVNHHLTVGVLLYTMQYINTAVSSFDGLMSLFLEFPKYRMSRHRMQELDDIAVDEEGRILLDKIERIELKGFNVFTRDSYLYSERVDCCFSAGNSYAITGKNGVGKSTLFYTLLGVLNHRFEGQLLVNGIDIGELDKNQLRKCHFSIMPQYTQHTGKTVREYLVDSGIEDTLSQEVTTAMETIFFTPYFNLADYLDCSFDTLSGGEKQLVSLFICLAKEADVYLLDEPIASLHPDFKQKVQQLLEDLGQQGKVVIYITHDYVLSQSIRVQLR